MGVLRNLKYLQRCVGTGLRGGRAGRRSVTAGGFIQKEGGRSIIAFTSTSTPCLWVCTILVGRLSTYVFMFCLGGASVIVLVFYATWSCGLCGVWCGARMLYAMILVRMCYIVDEFSSLSLGSPRYEASALQALQTIVQAIVQARTHAPQKLSFEESEKLGAWVILVSCIHPLFMHSLHKPPITSNIC